MCPFFVGLMSNQFLRNYNCKLQLPNFYPGAKRLYGWMLSVEWRVYIAGYFVPDALH